MRRFFAILVASASCLTACAGGEEDATASNAGAAPDGGTTVQEGSILPPVGDADDELSSDSEPSGDATGDVDPAFCASQSDGTACGSSDACNDAPTCVNGQCMPNRKPEGTVCDPASGPCEDAGVCQGGACQPASQKADGEVCEAAPSACHTDGKCSGGVCGSPSKRADGYNWESGDTWKRCCDGQALRMDSNSHCGVCGIQCNASNGESCQQNSANGQFYCSGCVSSAQCWSGCCSTSFGTPHRCAASDCVVGNCEGCPAGTCKTWSDASNSCSYD